KKVTDTGESTRINRRPASRRKREPHHREARTQINCTRIPVAKRTGRDGTKRKLTLTVSNPNHKRNLMVANRKRFAVVCIDNEIISRVVESGLIDRGEAQGQRS